MKEEFILKIPEQEIDITGTKHCSPPYVLSDHIDISGPDFTLKNCIIEKKRIYEYGDRVKIKRSIISDIPQLTSGIFIGMSYRDKNYCIIESGIHGDAAIIKYNNISGLFSERRG